MPWNRACGLALTLLSACTRPNFAYGNGDGDGTAADEDDTVATRGDADATRGDADTTRGDLDTTRGGSESEGTLDTGPSCVPIFEPPFGLHSSPEPWLQLPVQECPVPVLRQYRVRVEAQPDPNSLEAEVCIGACECGGVISLLELDAPLPELATGCYDLTVEFAPSDGEACRVLAYMLTDGSGPVTVVSNVIGPGFPQPFALQLADQPTTACELGCTPETGSYALVGPLGVPVLPPDETSIGYEGYKLVNYGSGIDAECSAVGRWVAQRGP